MAAGFRSLLWSIAWGLLVACTATPTAPDRVMAQDSTIVLSWNRDGGFAGLCDELKVTASGEATASSCRNTGAAKIRRLSNDDLSRLRTWRESYGAVAISSSDRAVADGIALKLTLAGTGRAQPSDAQRQELLDWAQRVYDLTQ
jgi:hypothetical protein